MLILTTMDVEIIVVNQAIQPRTSIGIVGLKAHFLAPLVLATFLVVGKGAWFPNTQCR
jgi:hypothetical protein